MATSLFRETGEKTVRAALLADVIKEFSLRYSRFLKEQSFASFKEEYEERLVNIGREVRLIRRGQELVRRAVGIDEEGGLLVQNAEGETECVVSGEVSVRGLYGYV